jgi:hypothetical protein
MADKTLQSAVATLFRPLNLENVELALARIDAFAQEKAESSAAKLQLRSASAIQTSHDQQKLKLHPAQDFFPLVPIN